MFDDFDTQIQCEEFYFEPSELDIEAGYYDDPSYDDYDWELWSRRQKRYAAVAQLAGGK